MSLRPTSLVRSTFPYVRELVTIRLFKREEKIIQNEMTLTLHFKQSQIIPFNHNV